MRRQSVTVHILVLTCAALRALTAAGGSAADVSVAHNSNSSSAARGGACGEGANARGLGALGDGATSPVVATAQLPKAGRGARGYAHLRRGGEAFIEATRERAASEQRVSSEYAASTQRVSSEGPRGDGMRAKAVARAWRGCDFGVAVVWRWGGGGVRAAEGLQSRISRSLKTPSEWSVHRRPKPREPESSSG